MDITDTTHSLLLISEELCNMTQLISRKTCEKLFQYLCSHQIGDETLKVLNFLAGKTSVLNHTIIKCDIL